MQKLLTALAWIVSVAFHPLAITVIGSVAIKFLLFTPIIGMEVTEPLIESSTTAFLYFYLMPLLVSGIYFMLFMKDDPHENERRHRIMLLIIVALIYALETSVLHPASFGNYYYFGCTLVIFVAAVVTIFWKISLHTLAMGGLIGFLLTLQLTIPVTRCPHALPIAIICAGLVGSARLHLKAHTPAQVFAGYVVGFLITCGVSMLW